MDQLEKILDLISFPWDRQLGTVFKISGLARENFRPVSARLGGILEKDWLERGFAKNDRDWIYGAWI